MVRVGIDAMGGDHAPREIVAGVVEAVRSFEDIHATLVGDRAAIERELAASGADASRLDIVHTTQIVAMDDPPVEALRQKRDSSIARLVQMAAERQFDAIISAGNTGAFVAACQLKMGTLEGISRPGIAVVMPSFYGPIVVCDVGANIAPKPHHLHDYAVMATVFAREIVGVRSPRVGLLSIGEESVKGTELIKQTQALLREDPAINFIGNVEGRSLFTGECDVFVCDGFVGNIVLKLTEGLAEGLFNTIKHEIEEESEELARRFDPIVREIWAKHDYAEYGGAPLLGTDGICIICHGRSDRRAIRNAVRVAREFYTRRLNTTFVNSLQST